MQGKLNELDKVELHFVRGRVRLGTSFWVCRCYNITSRMFLLTMVLQRSVNARKEII